jgi:Tol biopolymer transport system component
VGWSSDNKIGLFLRNPSHRAVYTIPVAGGKATQITPGASDSELKKDRGYRVYPKWSPDGKKVFLRWGGGNIATVPSQGGKMTIVHSREDTKIIPIVPGGGCDVSPDGKSIVSAIYKSDKRPFKFGIWTMQIGGGEEKHVAQNFIPDRHPCWSPDGKQIAFIRYIKKGGEPNIYTTSQDGEQIRKITSASDSVVEASIDWAPDGKHIAYLSKNKSINIVSIEGGEVCTIAEVNTLDGALAWSPKGDEIAYTSEARIWVVSVEGGESREVQTGLKGKVYGTIDWSPDGKKIIFTAASGGDRELWLMEDF